MFTVSVIPSDCARMKERKAEVISEWLVVVPPLDLLPQLSFPTAQITQQPGSAKPDLKVTLGPSQ